jgi:hypothetical protein
MTRSLNIGLALAAGVLGGLLSRNIAVPSVQAQAQDPKELRAQSFTLTDAAGHILGTFTTRPALPPGVRLPPDARIAVPSNVVLLGPDGHEMWSVNADPFRPIIRGAGEMPR